MKTNTNSQLRVSYGMAVHDSREIRAVTRVLKERRSILGRETAEFEKQVAGLFGKKYGVMVNSGSSANLLALEILNLPKGSEVITPLLTFATTLAPIVQKGLVPVFVDVKPGSYFADIDQIEKAITKKTRALIIPSLLGNVPDLLRLKKIATKHRLYFIEDSCDTIGATFSGKPTGTFSDISTTSFYGSHVITAGGGGGMICVNNPKWASELKVLRGWGRASAITESDDIDERYKARVGRIPYDAKYVYSKIGYNFLPLEISAAFGLVQLTKLKKFSRVRQRNFKELFSFFRSYKDFFILPQTLPGVVTNWLAFPLTIRPEAPFSRLKIVRYLEKHGIQTRPLFSGNVLKQPAFKAVRARLPYRSYPITDLVTSQGLIFGCHQGLEKKHLEYLKKIFTQFLRPFVSR